MNSKTRVSQTISFVLFASYLCPLDGTLTVSTSSVSSECLELQSEAKTFGFHCKVRNLLTVHEQIMF